MAASLPSRSGLVRKFTGGPDLDDEGADFESFLRMGLGRTLSRIRELSIPRGPSFRKVNWPAKQAGSDV
jgi:hypothetical protein